jgi:hypothetical protein
MCKKKIIKIYKYINKLIKKMNIYKINLKNEKMNEIIILKKENKEELNNNEKNEKYEGIKTTINWKYI